MADPTARERVPESAGGAVTTVVAYAKQEIVLPLRGVGRRVGLGVVGALVAGIGAIELVLALLRVLQEETGSTFTGSLTWIPYVITLVAVALAALLIFKLIDGRRDQAGSREDAR